MKTIFRVLASVIVIGFLTAGAYAQTSPTNRSGLYLTAQDYANKKLSYSNENSGKYKIRVAPLFNKYRVQVLQNGEKHNFFEFDLFGYKVKDQDYRFFNDQQYKVVDNSFFYLYTRVVTVDKGKAHTLKTNYYFSLQADGNIIDLTIENLKEAFPNNHKFLDLLDVYFRSDDDLKWYDNFNRMYKVEHIFGDTFDKSAYSFNE